MEVQTLHLRDLHEIFPDPENGLTFHQNVSIPMKTSSLPIRSNIYIPLNQGSPATRFPAIVTYGPYGKDIPYSSFSPGSFSEVNPNTSPSIRVGRHQTQFIGAERDT